ncbi:MAG: ribonuclease III [Methanospirillaceae archaeon]|nr:ribonuclease III [Methanospirillaceae archaeon]
MQKRDVVSDETREKKIFLLEKDLNYHFTKRDLLIRALTRYAYAAEHEMPSSAHMDALATLGDAVIDLVVLACLLHSGENEKGVLSTKKIDMVNMSALRDIGAALRLEEYVFWGRGEVIQHVWTSGRVLAECLEAVIGAVYLDGDLNACSDVLAGLGLIPGQ